MQQTNDALQELNNTRVLTEADQVRFLLSSDKASLFSLSATQENLDGQSAQTIPNHAESLSGSTTYRRPKRERESRSRPSDLLPSARNVGFALCGQLRAHVQSESTAATSRVTDGTRSGHASIERTRRTTARTRSKEGSSFLLHSIERFRRTSSKWMNCSKTWRNSSMNKAGSLVRSDEGIERQRRNLFEDSIQDHVQVAGAQTAQATRQLGQAEVYQVFYPCCSSFLTPERGRPIHSLTRSLLCSSRFHRWSHH